MKEGILTWLSADIPGVVVFIVEMIVCVWEGVVTTQLSADILSGGGLGEDAVMMVWVPLARLSSDILGSVGWWGLKIPPCWLSADIPARGGNRGGPYWLSADIPVQDCVETWGYDRRLPPD